MKANIQEEETSSLELLLRAWNKRFGRIPDPLLKRLRRLEKGKQEELFDLVQQASSLDYLMSQIPDLPEGPDQSVSFPKLNKKPKGSFRLEKETPEKEFKSYSNQTFPPRIPVHKDTFERALYWLANWETYEGDRDLRYRLKGLIGRWPDSLAEANQWWNALRTIYIKKFDGEDKPSGATTNQPESAVTTPVSDFQRFQDEEVPKPQEPPTQEEPETATIDKAAMPETGLSEMSSKADDGGSKVPVQPSVKSTESSTSEIQSQPAYLEEIPIAMEEKQLPTPVCEPIQAHDIQTLLEPQQNLTLVSGTFSRATKLLSQTQFEVEIHPPIRIRMEMHVDQVANKEGQKTIFLGVTVPEEELSHAIVMARRGNIRTLENRLEEVIRHFFKEAENPSLYSKPVPTISEPSTVTKSPKVQAQPLFAELHHPEPNLKEPASPPAKPPIKTQPTPVVSKISGPIATQSLEKKLEPPPAKPDVTLSQSPLLEPSRSDFFQKFKDFTEAIKRHCGPLSRVFTEPIQNIFDRVRFQSKLPLPMSVWNLLVELEKVEAAQLKLVWPNLNPMLDAYKQLRKETETTMVEWKEINRLIEAIRQKTQG